MQANETIVRSFIGSPFAYVAESERAFWYVISCQNCKSTEYAREWTVKQCHGGGG